MLRARRRPSTLRQFASEVKFFNESYCISCTVNDDGSDRCVTCPGRRKSDDSNGTSRVHIGKRRTSHLFETALTSDEEEETGRF